MCGSPTSKSRHCPDAARSVVPGEAGACHKCDWAYCMLRESRSTRASLTMCYLCAPVPQYCSAAWASGHGGTSGIKARNWGVRASPLFTDRPLAGSASGIVPLLARFSCSRQRACRRNCWLAVLYFLTQRFTLAATGDEWRCRCCSMAGAAVSLCAAGAVSAVGDKAPSTGPGTGGFSCSRADWDVSSVAGCDPASAEYKTLILAVAPLM